MKTEFIDCKSIAFYLPQYHAIPENDKAWGKGFTEWTNVKKAVPLVKQQYQPQEPLNDDYYSLLDVDTIRKQISLAKEYGIYGFCFYHYYFKNGKKLLEKPIELFLENVDLDIPFCLSWANEPWTKRWDGSENEVIVEQDYGNEDEWREHFEYLLHFFLDERYIRNPKTQKPLFLIYRPSLIPNVERMLKEWDEMAKKSGLPGIEFIIQYPEEDVLAGKIREGFDGIVEFEPLYTTSLWMNSYRNKAKFALTNLFFNFSFWKQRIAGMIKGGKFSLYSYDLTVKDSCNVRSNKKCYPGVFPGWDNTARKNINASCYWGNTPDKFYEYLRKKLDINDEVYHMPFIFINAWNEWGEGAHMEPDKKYKYGFLEAHKRALEEHTKSGNTNYME